VSDVDGFLLKHCYEPVSKVMGYILTFGKQRQCLFVTQKTKKKGHFVENNRILQLMFQSKIFLFVFAKFQDCHSPAADLNKEISTLKNFNCELEAEISWLNLSSEASSLCASFRVVVDIIPQHGRVVMRMASNDGRP
jgi:hypothetical protein